MHKVSLRCAQARRIQDPVTKGDRHFFVIDVNEIPDDIPLGPNPREQDIDKTVYKKIARSLLNEYGEPNAFFVKNKGITILAAAVERRGTESDGHFDVFFDSPKHGIVDGGHTYRIITENRETLLDKSADPENGLQQYVEVRVLTGSRLDGLVTDIAEGLNTSVQVQEATLANLAGHFEWVKRALAGSPMANMVAYKQNEDKPYTALDILSIGDLFNIADFPKEGDSYPTRAYDSPNRLLKAYLNEVKDREKAREEGRNIPEVGRWEKLSHILPDILTLYDLVASTGVDMYNDGGGKKGRRLSWVRGNRASKSRKTGEITYKEVTYPFHFLSTTGSASLYQGALMPMVGAFRCMIKENAETGFYEWEGGFDAVKKLWGEVGKTLMERTQNTSEELGRKPDAIGKSQNHWGVLFSIATTKHLQSQLEMMLSKKLK